MSEIRRKLESNVHIIAVIPAYNEEKSIPLVLAELPKNWVREVVVCDNNSSDRTAEVAKNAGATVVFQPHRGYGNACLKGLEYIKNLSQSPDIVVFIDADYSDYPEELPKLVMPILDQNMDMVIGSRALGNLERGAMTIPQIFGNWLATRLIRWIFGYRFTDLGPFRAIRYEKLVSLDMQDKNFGWTVEMQIKAAKMKFNCVEVPVSYRRRVGVSKISGTVKGTILAGHKIIWTILKNINFAKK